MTKRTYRYDPETDDLYEVTPSVDIPSGLQIMGDNTEYRSIITDEPITSRAQHREHLKEHGCHEVGSSAPAWLTERAYLRKHGATTEDFTRMRAEETAAQLRALEMKGVRFSYEDFDG